MTARKLALALALCLVGTACGSRLSAEQRAAGINAVAAGASRTATGSGGSDLGATDTGSGTVAGDSGPSALGSGGSAVSANVGGVIGSTGGSKGAGASTGRGSAGATSNGGKTDVGVTGNSITIATLADISGPRPGLFKSAHQAVAAFAAYINSQGGINGRALKPVLIDSKTDSGAYRAGVLDACDNAFALVGSMSAFDDTAKDALEGCTSSSTAKGIPDLPGPPTAQSHIDSAVTFPPFPNRGDIVDTGPPTYIAQHYPDAIKKAAILYIDAAAGKTNHDARKAAWEKVGFNFVYDQAVEVVEPNYSSFIVSMKNQGVQYVTFVGDNDTIARLMKAAAQQSWAPQVWDWDSVAYDPAFPAKVGDAGNGALIFTNTMMWEEAGSNSEMALYLQWLNRVAPGAQPDYFGLYAWSAARLFTDAALKAGPHLTRAALLTTLKSWGAWDGHGIHGPHQIGAKLPTKCFIYLKLEGGTFHRSYPASGMECNLGTLQSTS